MKRILHRELDGERALLGGDAYHHLVRVLRVREGEEVELFDGEGRARLGTVVDVSGLSVEIALGAWRDAPSGAPIVLAQAIAKGEKMDLVVQKATELGVARIVPLQLSRCVVRLQPSKGADRARRWRRIAEEAARQSGRADVPVVDEPLSLDAFLRQAEERGESVALLDEEADGQRWGRWLLEREGPVAFIVGPEGGITPEERKAVEEAGGARLSLGPRILRTETVALAALSVALHLQGELG